MLRKVHVILAAVGVVVVVLEQPLNDRLPGVKPVAEKLADMVPASVPMDSEPVRGTALVGENLIVTAQLALTSSLVPQVVETKLKSVPVTELAPGGTTDMGTTPAFVSVAVAVVDWPTVTLANDGVPSVAVGAVPCVAAA